MKKRNSYYDLICSELNIFSDHALAYGNTKAWANRKAKAFKRIVPRGKVFSRLHKQEWNALVEMVKGLSTKFQKIET